MADHASAPLASGRAEKIANLEQPRAEHTDGTSRAPGTFKAGRNHGTDFFAVAVPERAGQHCQANSVAAEIPAKRHRSSV
ncbi:MAG: hypothetical protein O7E49_08300 [Gemmatimonadetes bacterium]|nr:hypothetical protein [Gemmatimonadota bacterium]